MLNDELEKPEAEVDCEIIDMCIEMLAEIDHIKLDLGLLKNEDTRFGN